VKSRFPHIYETCLSLGIDITREPIPVIPAAHYFCGGILTDIKGRTSIRKLFAAGEVSCTGVHGANRLASNSLLEALVFAVRAQRQAVSEMKMSWGSEFPAVPPYQHRGDREEVSVFPTKREELRRIMWDLVGIVRSDKRLAEAQAGIDLIKHDVEELFGRMQLTGLSIELRNLVTIADLIVQSAIRRRESRGLHFNEDHPKRDDQHWRKDTVLSLSPREQ
jgi:L-aspartate oxidase